MVVDVSELGFADRLGLDQLGLDRERIDQIVNVVRCETVPVRELGQHTPQFVEDVVGEHHFQ
jgi:hypothetical protein